MASAEQHRISGSRARASALGLAVIFVLTIVPMRQARAQTFQVIHSFSGGPDGANPAASLTIDQAGNAYGTATSGGNGGLNCGGLGGCGTVFKLTHRTGWVLSPLYSFQGGDDGAGPDGAVLFGQDGTLYGTATGGGDGTCTNGYFPGCGVVFRLRPSARACRTALCTWTETTPYQFTQLSDGQGPQGDLVFDQAGNLYGTTYAGGLPSGYLCGDGGRGCGIVYKLTVAGSGWEKSAIYSFTGGNDGGAPAAGVVFDTAGRLYGTTELGGTHNSGTVYQLTPAGSGWTENVLYNFGNGTDGGYPIAGLIFDSSGNLYGATSGGGSGGGGTVFKLSSLNGSWTFTVLYSFAGNGGGPLASLTIDGAGSLYGTTAAGGSFQCGSVFKLTPSGGVWRYTSLHDFSCGNDGGLPYGGVSFDRNGNLYGTTLWWGPSGGIYCGTDQGPVGCGVVWEITP